MCGAKKLIKVISPCTFVSQIIIKIRLCQDFFRFVIAGLTYFLQWSIQKHHRWCLWWWFRLPHPSSSWSSPGSARDQPDPTLPSRREKSSNPLRLCYWTSTNQTSNNRTAKNWMASNWTANNQWSANWRVKKPKHEETKGENYKTANKKKAKNTEQQITKRQPSSFDRQRTMNLHHASLAKPNLT